MRSIPIDVNRLTFVCVAPARPRLISQETGEVKVDKDGRTMFQVGLSAADLVSGRVDLVTVNISGDPDLVIGQVVEPVGLVAFPWEMNRNGETVSGISFRADSITPVVAQAAA